jgi:1,4-dihydroxy-2-naphthoyl-CoA hydrolase
MSPEREHPVGRRLPGLPGMLGIRLTELDAGRVEATLTAAESHIVPDEAFIHAGALVTLADTACGYGCRTALPGEARGFITVELKTNLIKAAAPGDQLVCVATPSHVGRRTQIWDAVVTAGSSTRPVALFRCTQLVL